MVNVFLATRPEHKYAKLKLLKYSDPSGAGPGWYSLDAEKWAHEMAAANAAQGRAHDYLSA